MIEKKKAARWGGIVILCIFINVAGRVIANSLHLPIWLDTVGTCVASYFAGPLGALVVGVLPNAVLGLMGQGHVAYALTGVFVALAWSFCVRKQYIEELSIAMMCSFWIGLLGLLVSTPLNMLLYNGYPGNMWGNALYDMLDWYGMPQAFCAIAGQGIVELVDKQICGLLAFFLILFMKRSKNDSNKKEGKGLLKAISGFLMLSLVISLVVTPLNVNAKETLEDSAYNYFGTIYNNSTGIMSPEANVIEETDDGCIWIGSYAGLTRYDGNEFEFIREGGITNVTYLLNDSKGRLWIGTNDNGIARYEDGKFVFFKQEDGLPGNSIRSFVEASDGSVYVGTTDSICKFDQGDKITVLELDIKYVISMEAYQDKVLCVDNNGNVYALQDEKLLYARYADESGVFCNHVKATSKGVFVGTSGSYLYRLDLTDSGLELYKEGNEVIADIVGIEEGSDGRLWVCAEAGFGFVDANGKFYEQKWAGFDYSFEWIHQDYQGNLWLASSRYGVLKMSQSQFVNLFTRVGLPKTVVNAVVQYKGDYYCGTDSGLVILNGNDFSQVTDELTTLLEGERIRGLMVDSANNLWICGYGTKGLIRYDSFGNVESFTMESKGTTSDRFRCAAELKDKIVAIGTADGINFIQGDQVVGTITGEDGLRNSQILSMVVDEDGTLYAGTDGGGIYTIREQKIVAEENTQDGLTSDVILRLVPYDGGYIVVTSNSLCYKKEESIVPLKEFPYFNNYDVMIKGEQAYVFSSAGIYIVNAKELCSGKSFGYELLNYKEGLVDGLTANSWNWLSKNGNIFVCSNNGVLELVQDQASRADECKFGLMTVECDGEKITAIGDIYQIPKSAKKVTLRASVRNYALEDVKVRFFVEGMDTEPQAVSYQDLEPVRLTNLSHGNYTVKLQIVDDSEETVLQEKVYQLDKEVQMWENGWYKAYLAIVLVELVAFATGSVLVMINISKRKRELETLRMALEHKVDEQTKEIRTQNERMEHMFVSTVEALTEVVDAKDRYTSGHSRRVAQYSKMIAERMGKSEQECQQIYYAGLLHDMGKIRIPENIINKPGRLNQDEYEMIKIHPVTGYHILKDISEDMDLALGTKFHHERYDGKGYPNGLQGENIPEIARIIGVADAYDAMTSNRSYRKTLPKEVVREELIKGKGAQFDPEIADIMLAMMEDDKDYNMRQLDIAEKTILIVDDEYKYVEEIQKILEDEPIYNLISAPGGKEALEIVKKQKVDLLLIDIELPGMDGYETLKQMREITSAPVVFMTIDKNDEIIEKVFEMDADDYLTKPFLPMVFKEIIHSVLHSL